MAASIAEILAGNGNQPDMQMSPYTRPGVTDADLTTNLGTKELDFRQWVAKNKVPFDVNAKGPGDYDMRGFYQALMAGDPKTQTAVNPNDGMLHYPDFWKTPYHQSFSAESQWAMPQAPKWNERDQLVEPNGMVVFDERNGGKPLIWKR